jgi:hypothetical protein
VTYIRNVTDVDDKIIATANAEGLTTEAVVDRAYAAVDEAHSRLVVKPPTIEPWATHHIGEMVELSVNSSIPATPTRSAAMCASRFAPTRNTGSSRATILMISVQDRGSNRTSASGIRSTSRCGRRRDPASPHGSG